MIVYADTGVAHVGEAWGRDEVVRGSRVWLADRVGVLRAATGTPEGDMDALCDSLLAATDALIDGVWEERWHDRVVLSLFGAFEPSASALARPFEAAVLAATWHTPPMLDVSQWPGLSGESTTTVRADRLAVVIADRMRGAAVIDGDAVAWSWDGVSVWGGDAAPWTLSPLTNPLEDAVGAALKERES